MSESNSQSWGSAPIGILTVLLVLFLIWAFSGDRHFFRHTGRDIRASAQDAGHDLKESGRDLADSIRHTAQ